MPRHVREDAKKANEFIQAQAANAAGANGAIPPEGGTDETPPASAEAGGQGEGEQPPAGFETDYRQQYDTLKGKYNAEVPQLTEQVRSQSELITQLQAQLSTLKTQLEQGGAGYQGAGGGYGQQPPADADMTVDTATIRENFGEEFAQPFEQIVQQNEAQAAHISRLEKLVEQLSTRTNESSYDQRIATLTSELAKRNVSFAEVNTDPLFIDWLKKPDAFSGIVRQQILQQAVTNGDIPRAANIFFTYLSERQGAGQHGGQQPPANPLEQQVRVEQNFSGARGSGQQPTAWTEGQIAELYRAKRERRISPEEFKRLQDELFASPTLRARQ